MTALRAAGALQPHPKTVHDEAFERHEFFDRRDRVQVKYEMLRRQRVDGRSVRDVAATFGISRQAFYAAKTAFTATGLPGLLPRPRGPKGAHKCTDEILEFVERQRTEAPPAAGAGLGRGGEGAVRRRDPPAVAGPGAGASKKNRTRRTKPRRDPRRR